MKQQCIAIWCTFLSYSSEKNSLRLDCQLLVSEPKTFVAVWWRLDWLRSSNWGCQYTSSSFNSRKELQNGGTHVNKIIYHYNCLCQNGNGKPWTLFIQMDNNTWKNNNLFYPTLNAWYAEVFLMTFAFPFVDLSYTERCEEVLFFNTYRLESHDVITIAELPHRLILILDKHAALPAMSIVVSTFKHLQTTAGILGYLPLSSQFYYLYFSCIERTWPSARLRSALIVNERSLYWVNGGPDHVIELSVTPPTGLRCLNEKPEILKRVLLGKCCNNCSAKDADFLEIREHNYKARL